MPAFEIVIVTPALAAANNGNWQTAHRWARMLRPAYRVRLATDWEDRGADAGEALMIALHARRSAAAISRWRAHRGGAPVILVLTGTDLYRDIGSDDSARTSLDAADLLVVLNALGIRTLPEALRAKTRTVLQSSPARRPQIKTRTHLRALMVGHLRQEKSPQTWFEAARHLQARPDILLDHIGGALEPELGAMAAALAIECPTYRWLGALPHKRTRDRIQAAHLLVHPSVIEGGAHVVIEAIRSGTAVLASRIDGNVGLLGEDYDGYFAPGDAAELADRIRTLRDEQAMLDALTMQCIQRAPLFDPAREARQLHALVAECLQATR